MLFNVFVTLTLLCSVFAAPNPKPFVHNVRRATGGKSSDLYLVAFQPNCTSYASWNARLTAKADEAAYSAWDNKGWGFTSRLNSTEVNQLRANDEVLFIEEDGFVFASQTGGEVTQQNAPWGLGRLSTDAPLENKNARSRTFTYTFPESGGQGVTAYIIDTGIRVTHSEFTGRVSTLQVNARLGTVDRVGHGTHVAATIGGSIAGVAKNVNIVAVKALGDDGSGRQSDIVQAIDLVTADAVRNNRIAVINMSLGGSPSAATDAAVERAIAQGVTVVVAAGNEGEDARNSSPARVENAITVGASDINDNLASFSNFGPAVDIIAPGVAIFSAGIANDRAGAFLDGTSMASPHVAGLAAVVLSEEGRAAPAVVKQRVLERGVQNSVKRIAAQTSNVLLNF